MVKGAVLRGGFFIGGFVEDFKYPIVEVVWEDSQSFHGWSGELANGQSIIKSVGYATQDDEKGIVLVESIDTAPDSPEHNHKRWGCSNFIPRSAVREQATLRG